MDTGAGATTISYSLNS